MAFASVYSRAQIGIEAPEVSVEVQVAGGLPTLNLVGLPATAVRESKDRVRAALKSCGFDFPPSRITVNLAPAELPKDGARFDLAIALGILAASGQIKPEFLIGCEIYGELSLSGELRPISGVLPAALACRSAGRRLVIPVANHRETLRVPDARPLACRGLADAVDWLLGNRHASDETDKHNIPSDDFTAERADDLTDDLAEDLANVCGQPQARRALEIAAAGGHGLLMTGPPGCGKTMLARRLPGILPTLTDQQALEVASIASVSRAGFDPTHWGRRPFRSPHHSLTLAAMAGGGARPQPGEITLAHHGVLFLDELPEFRRETLEVLREPMERRVIEISRARHRVRYPAAFQLVAAMNPCPCGMHGEPDANCRCTDEQVSRYQSRISGPLLDRIDMHIRLMRVPVEQLLQHSDTGSNRRGEPSKAVRERVLAARQFAATDRQRDGGENQSRHERTDTDAIELLTSAANRLRLTARAAQRSLSVARTIADLEGSNLIRHQHVAEALLYRQSTN